MKIIVPMVPPSGNEMRRKYRDRFAYRDLREAWRRTIWALARGRAVASTKKTVRIHVDHGKLYDEDNLISGCKVVFDCLKALEYIVDDSPEWIESHVTQSKSPDRQTTIEVLECP